MNQGTFSDYHDSTGDGGVSYSLDFGGCWDEVLKMYGVFYDNDVPMSISGEYECSRLSKNQVLWLSTLTTITHYHGRGDGGDVFCYGGALDSYKCSGIFFDDDLTFDSFDRLCAPQ